MVYNFFCVILQHHYLKNVNAMNTRTLFKFLIVGMLLLLAIPESKGQHRITEAMFSDKIQKTIVREYNYPATVTYVETTDTHYFVYADESMQIACTPIDNTIHVLDFVIHDKKVYFCGFQNGNTTQGIWGWFDVSGLMIAPLTYHTYDGFNCQSQQVDTIHSLAVHEEQGEFHIAMVGANTDGVATRRWCLIDVWGTPGSTTGWHYEMGVPFGVNCPYDRMTHVCVTDNYIVVAGNYVNPNNSETYRIHQRNNVFSSSYEDSIYAFPLHNTGYIHDSVNFAMTPVYGDLVAVANKAYGFQSGYQNKILVNVYDMALTLATPAASPVYTMCTSVNIFSTGYSIRGMRYSANHSVLHLLLSGDSLPNTFSPGSIIAELPVPPTGIGSYTTLDDRILLSLDNYHSQGNTLAVGFDYSDASKLNYFTQPLQSASQCGLQNVIRYIDNGYSAKTTPSPYTTCTKTFKCKSRQIGSTTKGNDPVCP